MGGLSQATKEREKGRGVTELMKWFGVSWGAPMCDECPHVPPPIGEFCAHCDEAILANDSGVIYSNGPAAHRNCFIRGVAGSLAHLQKRCSCFVPGATEGDPPGMSKREAANAVAEFLGYEVEELMCDFCSAREPLVRDVHAKARITVGYKSGAEILDSGVWGACAECARLIDAQDWQGIIERAVVGSMALDPDLTAEWQTEYRKRLRISIEAVFGVKL
jgi:hypothetical protein